MSTKIIIAKFKSVCAETGTQIKKGQEMLYDYANKKCYSMGSDTTKKFKEMQQNNHEAENVRSYIDAQESAMFERYS